MPTPPTIEFKRHVHRLSEQETDELVEAVADLIVNFLKTQRDPARTGGDGTERNHERDRGQRSGRPA